MVQYFLTREGFEPRDLSNESPEHKFLRYTGYACAALTISFILATDFIYKNAQFRRSQFTKNVKSEKVIQEEKSKSSRKRLSETFALKDT